MPEELVVLRTPEDFERMCGILSKAKPYIEQRGEFLSAGYKSRLYENTLTLEIKRFEYVPCEESENVI